jgi:hypothetical protein
MLVLNFSISFWNAYACGAQMGLAKQAGGFSKLMLWSGLTMSACGFTWCYLAVLSFVGMYVPDFLNIHGGAEVDTSVKQAMLVTPELANSIMSLGYAVIILPILGSGMAIWLESLVRAWKERSFGNIAVASWNTFANVNNIYGFAQTAPSVWGNVGKLFKGDKNAAKLVFALVVLAVLGGILTTYSIAQWSNKKNYAK